jgi:hypothetical protein
MGEGTSPVFDRAQLERRTLGSPALEVEILALFVAEAERLLRQVENADDPQIRGDRLRAMITLARHTGAMRLAHAARALETEILPTEPDLQPLREALAEAIADINGRRV